MNSINFLLFIIFSLFFTACNTQTKPAKEQRAIANSNIATQDSIIYKTTNLEIKQTSLHTYQHISYLSTHDFGSVACNGMAVVNNNEAVIFDTPADDSASTELIQFVTQNLNAKVQAVVPTHFHQDCVGGLAEFKKAGIPIYANNKTIGFLKKNGNKLVNEIKGFNDSIAFGLGTLQVFVQFVGEGHTKDNVVAYFPTDSVLFGGCLVKELGANKGNLEDANVNVWSVSVANLKAKYPDAKVVIPGHGKVGGTDLLDYTIALFAVRE